MFARSIKARDQVAAEFVTRLHSGELSANDEKALSDWFEKDPLNVVEYENCLHMWTISGGLANEKDIIEENFFKPVKISRASNYKCIAASIVALLFVSLTIMNVRMDDGIKNYETQIGEQSVISLEDGSIITLNTNSKISVNITKESRQVTLDYGEAYFDVSRDESRPFSVQAGERTVSVLGTEFNILLDGEKTKIAVLEGLVAVHDVLVKFESFNPKEKPSSENRELINQQMLLEAGSVVTFLNTTESLPIREQYDNMARLDEWRKNIITFDEKSMLEVLKELNRYSAKKILVEDRMIIDLKVSGVFPLTDIDSILEGMEQSFPVNIIRYSDRIVIVGKKNI